MGGDNHDGSLKIGIWVYILLLTHCVALGKPLPFSMSKKWSSYNVHLGDFGWTKLEGCALNFLEWWWLLAASLYFLLETQWVWVTRVSSHHNLFWKKVSFWEHLMSKANIFHVHPANTSPIFSWCYEWKLHIFHASSHISKHYGSYLKIESTFLALIYTPYIHHSPKESNTYWLKKGICALWKKRYD